MNGSFETASLLRVYIGESDRCDGKPLFEAIVNQARQREMAGVTVLRGLMGFGRDKRTHTTKILRLAENLPVVVELVDRPEKIEAFAEAIEEVIGEGVMTIDSVKARYIRKTH